MSSLVGAVAGKFIGGKLFGGDKDSKRAGQALRPMGINAGGLTADGSGSVVSSGARRGLVNQLSGTLQRAGEQFGGLRDVVGTPGDGILTNSLRGIFGAARRRTLGNLRDSFERRRIGGSSFAADRVGAVASEFALRESAGIAQATMQELDAQQQLIGREADALAQSTEVKLNELNFQVDVAQNLMQVNGRLAAERSRLYEERARQKAALGTKIGTDIFDLATAGIG